VGKHGDPLETQEIVMNDCVTIEQMKIGGHHYRAFVGPPDRYDLMSTMQFVLFTSFLGMREHDTLLDIGCGSLRAGRLFVPYLNARNYYGVEPEKWLVEEGIRNELGQDLVNIKKPSFLYVDDFSFTSFNVRFDFIVAQSIFSHASPDQINACLINAERCMHETSLFGANFMVGKRDYEGKDWVYPGMVTYTRRTISYMIACSGLFGLQTCYFHPKLTWWLIGKPENKQHLIALRKRVNKGSRYMFDRHHHLVRHKLRLKF
jgi:hypothetical protein